uniref:Palmitoyltransferase n=1 Tax=Trieres chinensis TaxID=1514140 RepID=A0A6U1VRN8_TRICV|mmetsp:Transcript_27009/g.55306  ORF Transcript_27009/g.55306 Transcript_27009/m.55306 type:complete len:429 (+) Transcript_27009:237-1523(+)
MGPQQADGPADGKSKQNASSASGGGVGGDAKGKSSNGDGGDGREGPKGSGRRTSALGGRIRATCHPLQSCCHKTCGVDYDHGTEVLEYDYSYDDTARGASRQPLPRIRERGDFYIDSYNGEPWGCGFGTNEESGIWMNSGDQAGTIMAALVWLLMLYSAATVTLLTVTEGINPILGMIYCLLCVMALSCHAKTSTTDPGSVPRSAVPQESQRRDSTSHSMCGQCQTFKPPMSHHCRICNRCVSRMDHHCPWMNNCVGAANLKHFLLFLVYTWSCAAYSLTLFGWNYFFCADEDCTFHVVVVHLVRVMTVLCIGAFLFTSSMLMNVTYGLMTGIGTIDRLKKKATNTMSQSDEEPIPLKDVFGIAGYHTWPFPVDPVFEDYDRVMGYSTPQRLVREQQLMERKRPNSVPDIMPAPTVELPNCVNDFLPV